MRKDEEVDCYLPSALERIPCSALTGRRGVNTFTPSASRRKSTQTALIMQLYFQSSSGQGDTDEKYPQKGSY